MPPKMNNEKFDIENPGPVADINVYAVGNLGFLEKVPGVALVRHFLGECWHIWLHRRAVPREVEDAIREVMQDHTTSDDS